MHFRTIEGKGHVSEDQFLFRYGYLLDGGYGLWLRLGTVHQLVGFHLLLDLALFALEEEETVGRCRVGHHYGLNPLVFGLFYGR